MLKRMLRSLFFLIILIASLSAFAARRPLLKILAEVDQKIVTTRDVEAYYIVSKLLDGSRPSQVKFNSADSSSALEDYLIASMVFNEAQSFGIAKITSEEIESAYKGVKQKLNESSSLRSHWNFLDYEEAQLKDMVSQRLRAEKLIKYKNNSASIQVTDEEAKDYFEKNRAKFGSENFESFKPTIKKYIAQRSSETRMREWIEILKKKHKVKKL